MQKIIFFSIIIFLTSACNTSQEKKVEASKTDQATTNSQDKKLVEQIFYNVPSPLEMAQMTRDAGMQFNSELTNPTENKQYYIDQTTQALNLGVYGADLSYARIFDQVQEAVNFLAVIRELTESLQIPQDKETFALDKIEKHINNRDTLLHIITEIYSDMDIYLKENNRGIVAAMIITGGWIEGNYLALQSMNKEKPNEKVLRRVAEQKLSLASLIELIKPHVRTNHKSGQVLADLEELYVIYEDVTIETKNSGIETDSSKGKTTIKGNTRVEIDQETLQSIQSFINDLRKDITNP
ncbi:MAG TPA: hypothetical protein VJ937_06870 [Salinivirga sp.]|uniref:hypothetical protein n=1 Tax=Salinivirga sp. TaxID=1970192 RepID=UPI002B47E548|nr:hypothetical protein [Salinivirga sp.]HKK59182.1 hypothetical protein [Salinivirga sp.]